uniref:Methyltransferase type 11 domain-containing protein n=1 Tax=Neobodo designis TaxID=312471 RepID=A0A7S1Q1I5_NEODS
MLRCRVPSLVFAGVHANAKRFCASQTASDGSKKEAAAAAEKEAAQQGEAGSSDSLEVKDAVAGDGKYKRVVSREFDDTIVEKYSKAALEREGRADRIESEDFNEDTSYVPVLMRPGQKNVYDYTDDIPADIKPLYSHQPYQQREYIRGHRERAERPLWKQLLRYGAGIGFFGMLASVVEFTRIWLSQPQEVARLRLQILENSYGKVLELGAGHGLNIGSFPYPVHEVVMVDQSQQLLDKLHYRIPKTAYPKYSTCQDRAERLENFADGEFDCVIDMFGLCHYRDPVLALRQMQRVVKPTGTILLLEHGRSPYPPINWVLDYFADRHTMHTHGCLWNLPLREYFKEARLVVRELEQFHYGTTYYCIAHPEVLDEEAMKFVPKRDQMVIR